VGPLVVALFVAGTPEDAARLEEVVRELVARQGATVVVEHTAAIDPRDVVTPRPEERPPLARAWIDVGGSRAAIYVADRPWQRILVREVPLPSGLDEVAREEIAHILEATVEALASGEAIGRPREEVRRSLGVSPTAPPDPAPARSSIRLRLGAFWEAQGFSTAQPIAHGPGALVEASLAGGPAAWTTAAWRLPIDHETPEVGIRVQGVAARLLAGPVLGTGRVAVRPGFGGGADFVRVQPLAISGSGVRLARPRWTIVPFLRVALGLELEFFGDTRLSVSGACDVDLVDSFYFLGHAGADREAVLDPWTIRPSIVLGVVR